MRYIYLYNSLLSLLLTAIMVSCEQKEITFEGPYHVRFTETTGSARESVTEPIRISVHYAGPTPTEAITVNYSVSGNAREGIDYEIRGTRGTVTIPAGEHFGYIDVQLINNANNILEAQDIVFIITRVSPETIEIGRSTAGIIGSTTTFTIVDDCILGGTYLGVIDAQTPPVTGITMTSDDCETYTLSNWNLGLIQLPSIKLDLTFVDNYDNTLTIPKQFEERLSPPSDTIQGTGSVNPQNGTITLNLELKVRIQNQGDTTTRDSTLFFPLTFVPER